MFQQSFLQELWYYCWQVDYWRLLIEHLLCSMNCLMKNPFCLHRNTYIFCCCCSWEFTFLEFLWQASLRLAPLRFSDFSCGLHHSLPRSKSLDGAGCMCSLAKLCLTLWDPMDCSLPCSPVHGISQARILDYHFLLQGLFPTQVKMSE